MFSALTGWHWLALGIALLLLEVLGVGGILLGVGAGAIVTALVLAVFPISWKVQLVLFGSLSFLATIVFWKFFRVKRSDNETNTLNNRMARLVGARASLMADIKGGRSKIQFQDALWAVSCDKELHKGAMVEVISYDESLLHVIEVDSGDEVGKN